MTSAPSSSSVKARARSLGFDLVGIASVRPSDHGAFYRAWLEAGYHGDMGYLARPDAVGRRLDPRVAFPALRSAVVVAHNYYVPDGDAAAAERGDAAGAHPAESFDPAAPASTAPHPAAPASTAPLTPPARVQPDPASSGDHGRGIIARYARGRDYHKVIKKKLLRLLSWIEDEVGRELPAARAYVDTGPVLERELAQRAGLGWFGRNTMLIDPRRGSYFFLGTLFLELELEPDAPFEADHCGSCNACVEACPTGALLGRTPDGAPLMDATRCISYLTIEHRGPIPRELRPLIGNHVFGCDICQSCCPWNGEKFVELTKERDYRADWRAAGDRPTAGPGLPGTDSPSLIELMRMTRKEWDAWTRGTALRRAGYAGLKRNVAVALGNWGSPQAVPALVEALRDAEPLVRGHAAWALGRVAVAVAEAREALRSAVADEQDPFVRDEFERVLGARGIAELA